MNQERIDKIMARLKDFGASQALISDPYTLSYITGDKFNPGERFLALLLREGCAPKLFLNRLFTAPGVPEENIIFYDDSERGALKVLSYLDSASPLGIDKKLTSDFLLELQGAGAASKYFNASPYVDRVRAQKDATEAQLMIRASQLNEEALGILKPEVREGVTERELADRLSVIYRDLGAEDLAFPSIVCFGANAADPHHSPDDTPLKKGQCVLFDIGCVKDGYCSDMTRTYYFGEASELDREIYDVTLRANLAAESIIKPGVRCCDIDAAARCVIVDAGYGPNFTHRLGHSIGQEDHEWGDVGIGNTEEVKPGMVFSCEPGIYLPGKTGVRIEDLCMVTESGVKILNVMSKDLEILS